MSSRRTFPRFKFALWVRSLSEVLVILSMVLVVSGCESRLFRDVASGPRMTPEPISVGVDSKLFFSVQPSSEGVAGIDLATQPQVSVQDGSGNTVVGATDAITLAVYTDSGCTAEATGTFNSAANPVSASAGVSTFAGINYSKSETIYLKATATGLTSACSSAIVVSPAAATKFVLSGPASVGAGVCSSEFTLTTSDSYNNTSAVTSETVANLSGGGSGFFYSDSDCADAVTLVTVASGTSSNIFYFKDVLAESLIFSASGTLATSNLPVTITVGAASKLGFTTQPSSEGVAGIDLATQPQVSVQDGSGNITVGATDAITLAAYTDSGCTAEASGTFNVTANPVSASGGVSIFAGINYSKSETIYLKATATGLTSACSSAIVVSPAAATKFVLSGPTSVGAGVCSSEFTLTTSDSYNNTSAVTSETVANLSGGGSGFFYSDSDCADAVTLVTVASGTSSKTFYFKDVLAESLIFSASGALATSNLPVTITVGAASKLGFTTQPSSEGVAGVDLATQPQVSVQDGSGNITVGATDAITLAAYTDSGCTAEASGTFNVTANPVSASGGVSIFAGINYSKSETIYLKATATGLTSACSSAIVVSPAEATQLAYSTQPSSEGVAGVNLTTQPQVAVRDSFGNTATAATNSITLAAYTDSGCTAEASGTFNVTANPVSASGGVSIFAGINYSKSEMIYLKATATGLTSVCSSGIVVSPAAATKFVLSGPASVGAGVCSSEFTLTTLDPYNNTSTVTSETVANLSGGGSGFFYSDSDCTDAVTLVTVASSTSSKAFYFKDSLAESLIISASGTLATSNLPVTITVGAASKLGFTTQPSSEGVAGVDLATQPQVSVQDGSGNTVVGATDAIMLAVYTDSGCTAEASGTFNSTTNPVSASAGVSTFAGINYSKSETIYLKATATGLTSACSSAIVVSPAAGAQLVYTTQPSSEGVAGANLTTQPQVTVRDVMGNTATAATDSITLAAYTDSGCTAEASGTFNSTANPVSASAGVSTFAGINYSKSETIYLKATATGLTSACSSAVVVSPAAGAQLVYTTQPSSEGVAGANLTTQPQVAVRDSFGNTAVGATDAITLAAYTDSGCTVTASGTFNSTTNPVSASGGVSTFAGINYSKSETIYLKATATGLTSACSSGIVVSPAAATKFVLSGPASVGAGVCSSEFTLTTLDPYNNTSTVTSETVANLSGGGSGFFYSDSDCADAITLVTVASSTSSKTFYFKDSLAESLIFSASGALATSNLPVTITVGAASKLGFTTQPSSEGVAGVDLATQPQVSVQDGSGNTVVVATNAITLAAYTDSGCTAEATETFNITTNPVSASAGVSTFAGINYSKSETIYLKATATGLTSACSSAIVVSPAEATQLAYAIQPSGAGVAGVDLETQPQVAVRDSFGNTVIGATDAITLAVYTDSGCTAEATGTFNITTNPVVASAGVSLFAGINYSKSETIYLKATATGLSSACSSGISVSAAQASQLAFTVQPTHTISNTTLSPSIQVVVRDAFNNLNTGATNTITIAIGTNPSGGVLTGTASSAASSGVASFSGLSINSAGTGYTLTATATGLTGATSSAFNILSVPTVSKIMSSTASGAYTVGQNLSLQVVFSENVTVNGGTPNLLLNTGSTQHQASYSSGSGTTTLVFDYTVLAGDLSTDLDYASTAALTLEGATIKSADNANANLTLPLTGSENSLAGQADLVIDTINPAPVTSIDDGSWSLSLSQTPTITWSAGSDADSGVARYDVAIGTTAGGTDVVDWTSSGTNLFKQFSGLSLSSTTTYYASIRTVDHAGNTSTVGQGNGWTIDVDVPASFDPVDDGVLYFSSSSSPIISWTASSDSLSGILGYDLAIGTAPGGTDILDFTSVGNVTSYQATGLTLSGSTNYYATVKAKDNAGNSTTVQGNGYRSLTQQKVVDSVAPSVRSLSTSARFGYSSTISEDGTLLAIGALLDDLDDQGANSIMNAGAVYVYVQSGGSWAFQQKIVATGTNARMTSDMFGNSVSLSGTTLAVGAYGQAYDDSGANSVGSAGAVYLFTQSGSVWSLQQKIVPTGTNARILGDNFGKSVSLSGDALAVGTSEQDYDESGANSMAATGAVFVYTRSSGFWSQQQKIVATGINARNINDRFASTISLSGTVLAVGALYHGFDADGANSLGQSGAVFIYTQSGGVWTQQQKIVATGTNARLANDTFGQSVSLSGTSLAVGANQHDYDEFGENSISSAGAVYVFTQSDGVWSLQQKIVAGGTNARVASDYFGATVSLSGTSLAVGAYQQSYDASGTNSVSQAGAVYIYTLSGGVWTQQQKIVATGTNARMASDNFGFSLSLSSTTLVVGSWFQDYDSSGANSVTDAGAAHGFTLSEGVWTQNQKLVDTIAPPVRSVSSNAYFGISTALSEDGSILAIGASQDSLDGQGANSVTQSGAVYLFVKSSGSWILQQKLVPSGTNARMASDHFGIHVSVSGETLAVGANWQDYDDSGSNSVNNAGAVYLFTRSGDVWSQQQKIVATGTNARVASDYFGSNVSLSGTTLAIGVSGQDFDDTGGNSLDRAGAVYVFTDSGGVWSQQQKIVATGTNARVASDYFGTNISLSGTSLAIGASGQDFDDTGENSLTDAGAVYVYNQSGEVWTQQQKIVATGTNSRMGFDGFGSSVSLSDTSLAIGSPYQSYNASGTTLVTNAGAVYMYTQSGGVWTQQQKVVATGTNSRMAANYFGRQVAMSGTNLAVGAHYQSFDTNGANSVNEAGAVYVYTQSGSVWTQQQKIVPTGTNARKNSDHFGSNVALSGTTLAIGVMEQDYDANGSNSISSAGAAFIYH